MSFVVYMFEKTKTVWLTKDNTWSDQFKKAKTFEEESEAKKQAKKLKARHFPIEPLKKANSWASGLALFPIRKLEEKWEIDWEKVDKAIACVGVTDKIWSEVGNFPYYKGGPKPYDSFK